MYVVHLIARLNDGGPARVIASLARALLRDGHRVAVWTGTTAADEPDLSTQLVAAGIEVVRVPGLGPGRDPVGDARAACWIRQRLHREAPDLLHTHTAKAGVLGRVIARSLGRRCLHSYHGHVLHGYFRPGLNLLLRRIERWTSAGAHLHTLTPSLVRELHQDHGIGRPERWHSLPVPCPAVTPAPAPWQAALRASGAPVVGFLGRCVPVKDLPLFLAVIAHLAAAGPVQGLICGDGRLRAAMERVAAARGLPVRFVGQVPAGEALAAMDLLLMTSRNEGLPLAAIEAASLGLPVVAPAVGGLRDLADRGVVEAVARDSRALAAAVQRRLAARPEDPAAIAARRQAAARYAAPAVVPAYLRLYARLCAGPARP